MIKKIDLLELSIEGFRRFKDKRVVSFKKELNTIIGDNEKGKSTIGYSLAWLFTGQNFEGKKNELGVINDYAEFAHVELKFFDELGNSRTLGRKLTQASMIIRLDGAVITQKALNAEVDSDTFLSIFNPLMYLKMDTQKMRQYFQKHAKQLSHEEVLKELPSKTVEILESHTKLVESLPIDSVATITSLRQEIKKNDDSILVKKGIITKTEMELSELVEKPVIQYDETALIDLKSKIATLKKSIPVLDVEKTKSFQLKKEEIALLDAKNQTFKSDMAKLQADKDELAPLLKDQEGSEFYTSLDKDLSFVKAERERLLIEYKETRKNIKKIANVSSFIEKLEEKEVATVLELIGELHATQSAKLTEIETQGIASKTKEESIVEKIASQKSQWEKIKTDKIKLYTQKIQDLDIRIVSKQNEFDVFSKTELVRLVELKKELEGVDFDSYANSIEAKAREIKSEIAPLTLEVEKLEREKTEIEKSNQANQLNVSIREGKLVSLETVNAELLALGTQKVEMDELLDACYDYQIKKSELSSKSISALFTNVSFIFEKVIKATNEIKPCFEIIYKGKSLEKASKSDLVKTGLEISKVISKLSESVYPVFIDDGEGITKFNKSVFNQLIRTVVTEDSELKIVYSDGSNSLIETIPTAKVA